MNTSMIMNLAQPLILILILTALLCFTCQSMQGHSSPSIKVSNQTLETDKLIIDEVLSKGPGWIVIHRDYDGQPGAVLGHCKVVNGRNEHIKVSINPEQVTLTLYASLHIDAGMQGTFEFPDVDLPVKVNGKDLIAVFQVQ